MGLLPNNQIKRDIVDDFRLITSVRTRAEDFDKSFCQEMGAFLSLD